jgi:peroxiredoxin
VLAVAACTTENNYQITGEIADAEGVTFVLQKRDAGQTVLIDSAVVADGKFVIEGGSVEYPEQVQIIPRGKRGGINFYLENSAINIKAHIDSLQSAVVTGSKTQEEVNELAAAAKPIQDKMMELNSQYREAAQAGDAETASSVREEIMALSSDLRKLNLDFVKTNTTSFHAPVLLNPMITLENLDEMEGYLKAFSVDVASSKVATDLADRIALMKSVSVGQKAPDFTLNDADGNPVTLYSKVGTKLLMLDFWASWCGPCRAVNPDKVRTYNDFKDKGFDIIAVSLDRNKEDWLKGIEEDKLTWTHVSALIYWDCPVRLMYGINSIPASALIDENGIIVARNLRGQALYDKVSEILGN